MDCRQVHQAYSVYLQGKLPPTQREWIAQHIQDCPDCRLLDQDVRKLFLKEALGKSGEPPSS